MTIKRTAAAETEAEVHILGREVERTRREVGETVAALVDRIVGEANPRALAQRGLAWGSARIRRAVAGMVSRQFDAGRRTAARVASRPYPAGVARVVAVTVAAAVTAAVVWRTANGHHGNRSHSRR